MHMAGYMKVQLAEHYTVYTQNPNLPTIIKDFRIFRNIKLSIFATDH